MSRYDDMNKVWDDRAFKGYARFTDKPARHLLAAGTALAVAIAALVLGGWQIGWWFTGQNVNRESHVLRNSYANQQTLRDQVTQNIGNVLSVSAQVAGAPTAQRPALIAERAAIVSIVCGDAEQVAGDPLPADQQQFVRANCRDGAISPSSAYYSNQ